MLLPNLELHIPTKIPSDTGMKICPVPRELCYLHHQSSRALIRLHRIQKFFDFTNTVTLAFFIVLMVWTMGPEGFGSSGTSLPVTGSPDSAICLMIYGIMSTIVSIAAGILKPE